MPNIYDGISGNDLIEEINNYSIDSRGKTGEKGAAQEINSDLTVNGTLYTQGDMKVLRNTPIGNDIRDVITYEYLHSNFIKYYSKIIEGGNSERDNLVSLGYPFGDKVDNYHFLIGAYTSSSTHHDVDGYRYGSYGSFGENFIIHDGDYGEYGCYVQILSTGEVKVRPGETMNAYLQILAFPVNNVS